MKVHFHHRHHHHVIMTKLQKAQALRFAPPPDVRSEQEVHQFWFHGVLMSAVSVLSECDVCVALVQKQRSDYVPKPTVTEALPTPTPPPPPAPLPPAAAPPPVAPPTDSAEKNATDASESDSVTMRDHQRERPAPANRTHTHIHTHSLYRSLCPMPERNDST